MLLGLVSSSCGGSVSLRTSFQRGSAVGGRRARHAEQQCSRSTSRSATTRRGDRLLELQSRKRPVRQSAWIAGHLKDAPGPILPSPPSPRIGSSPRRPSGSRIDRPLAMLRHLLRWPKRWKAHRRGAGDRRGEGAAERAPLAHDHKSRNTTLADLVEFALFTGVRRASRSGSHRGTSTGLVVSSARRSKPRRPP
jgi:hypothetical protein